jgi:hypothetical protein
MYDIHMYMYDIHMYMYVFDIEMRPKNVQRPQKQPYEVHTHTLSLLLHTPATLGAHSHILSLACSLSLSHVDIYR